MMVKAMEEKFDLQELFQVLKKHLALIIMLSLVAASASGILTHFFITPIFQATTQLVLVPSAETPFTQGEISANLQMINTFNEVIVSPMILDEVIEKLGLPLTVGGVRSMMSAANRSNSQVITLTVRSEDPVLASSIANTTAEVFEAEILENFHMDNVRILARAQTPTSPVSPRLMLNIAMGFVVGTLIGLFLTFMLDYLDKTVKTEREIEKLIDIPVLGVIPMMSAKDVTVKKQKGKGKDPKGKDKKTK